MIAFEIRPDHQPAYRLTATTRDISKWERARPGRSFGAMERDGVKFAELEEIAWNAAVRLGHFEGPLKDWRDQVDATPIKPDELTDAEAAASDPTQLTP